MGFEKNVGHIRKLEDISNVKSEIFARAKKAIDTLVTGGKYSLNKKTLPEFYRFLEETILDSEKTKPEELEAAASQGINLALQHLKLERPGFTNEFVSLLKEKIPAKSAAEWKDWPPHEGPLPRELE